MFEWFQYFYRRGNGNKRILFVTPDKAMVTSIQKDIKYLFQGWELHFAHDGRHGAHHLSHGSWEVIVVDTAIRDASVRDLLKGSLTKSPNAIRILLTNPGDSGYATVSLMSVAHRFLTKPCNLDALKVAIHQAMEVRLLLCSPQMQQVVAKITVLPQLPHIFVRVMEEMDNPEASARSVGALIAQDVSISAKVLNVVNSAYFGVAQRVADPSQAVSLLGMDTVRSIVLLFDVFAKFQHLGDRVPDFKLAALQRHSLAVAAGARAIARKESMDPVTQEHSYLAGLFHDIGKLVMLANFTKEFAAATRLSREQQVSASTAEWKVLGVTHTEIGAYLLGLWGFADPVIEACAYHHHPRKGTNAFGFSPLMAVHAADAMHYATNEGREMVGGDKMDVEYLRENYKAPAVPMWQELCARCFEAPTGGR
jgi:putative nucleotidyltransferase with HDIG domain